MRLPFTTIAARLTGAVLAGAVLAGAALAGCGAVDDRPSDGGGRSGGGDTLTVFAAASLTEAFTTLGKVFERSHPGTKVRFGFGGSSTLAAQIVQGAPADVFAAASTSTMKPVTDAGLAGGSPQVFARNRLEIATPPDNPGRVHELRDLADPRLKVVLCAPAVPCGAAATKSLAAAGVTVKPVSLEQDVKAALTKVRIGEADAALVYRTDVRAAGAAVHGIDFPEAAQSVGDYPIAVLNDAPHPRRAGEFLRFVLSAQGRTILTAAGFESP